MKIPIIIETTHFLALNKPAGLIVERNPWEPSVESIVYEYLQRQRPKPFLGVVHRLDRVTLGVLLMAQKKSALKELNRQFAERQIKKIYLAVVEQAPPASEGKLEHWLFKDQPNKRAVVFEQQRKDTVFCSLSYRTLGEGLLEIRPDTGKFHQIRAQLAAIGCPIVGDGAYGAQTSYQPNAIMLHAWKLGFKDPQNGEAVLLEAPLPEDEQWGRVEWW